MEDVAGGLLLGIARIVKWIIIEFFIEVVVYGYGYGTLKVITFGRLPKPDQDNTNLCMVTGVVSMALTLLLIYLFFPSA